jgi:hypothetical protein
MMLIGSGVVFNSEADAIFGHPAQPGHLAARLLADDRDIKPRHFGDWETIFT